VLGDWAAGRATGLQKYHSSSLRDIWGYTQYTNPGSELNLENGC